MLYSIKLFGINRFILMQNRHLSMIGNFIFVSFIKIHRLNEEFDPFENIFIMNRFHYCQLSIYKSIEDGI